MSRFPPMRVCTTSFLVDTAHLSAEQAGVYALLLIAAWQKPGGRLPNNDAKLAKWARVSPRAWAKMKPVVLEFWTASEGFWLPSSASRGGQP